MANLNPLTSLSSIVPLQPLNWNIIPNKGTPPSTQVPVSSPDNYSSEAPTYTQERLFAVLPRSAANLINPNQYKSSDARGEIAYIKLISSKTLQDLQTRMKEDSLSEDVTSLAQGSTGYRKFFLTDTSCSYNEQMQVHKTFGDGEVVYFFGKQPMVFNFSGILFDSIKEDWFTKFINLYSTFLRGTQLAQNNELVSLILPNMKLKGYIISLSHTQNSVNDSTLPFTFQFFVKELVPTKNPFYDTNLSSFKWKTVDWTAGKGGARPTQTKATLLSNAKTSWGVGGYQTPASGNLSGVFGTTGTNLLTSAQSIGSGIDAFSKQLFNPVYGIISSITQVVANVTGDTTKILTAITNPAFAILQGITNVARQATSLVSMIEGSAASILAIPSRGIKDFQTALNSLKGAAGAISNLPEDLSQMVQRTFNSGHFTAHSAILKSTGRKPPSQRAVLTSGPKYSPAKAYTL